MHQDDDATVPEYVEQIHRRHFVRAILERDADPPQGSVHADLTAMHAFDGWGERTDRRARRARARGKVRR